MRRSRSTARRIIGVVAILALMNVRIPRVRFTVRRMMLAVAIAALLVTGGRKVSQLLEVSNDYRYTAQLIATV